MYRLYMRGALKKFPGAGNLSQFLRKFSSHETEETESLGRLLLNHNRLCTFNTGMYTARQFIKCEYIGGPDCVLFSIKYSQSNERRNNIWKQEAYCLNRWRWGRGMALERGRWDIKQTRPISRALCLRREGVCMEGKVTRLQQGQHRGSAKPCDRGRG